MSLKWTGNNSESGILRKSEFKEKKEELFVFGYSCKLFRDDDRAQLIDQGKHLIPWMGDETLKIDRYDARGALHDLSRLEAPPGGYDWRVELTRGERDVEQLCDEERYRALHTDEDEEEMYKEEELKRLHAAGYGQVGFNYDTPAAPPPEPPAEVDELFVPTVSFKALLPQDIVLPETEKQNAIIEKTAKFIARQGAQMEILIKAKQRDNPQFEFLNRDSSLHPYYVALTALVKADKWPEKKPELIEEKPHHENEDYLHPSLACTIIESAPSIPSIHYKPSADCDYTMLISKMRGEATLDDTSYSPELAPGEVAPPGTEPLPPRAPAEISRAPVMYPPPGHEPPPPQTTVEYQQQYAAYYHQYMAQTAALQAQAQAQVQQPKEVPKPTPVNSTGLSLMKNYNTDSDSDVSDCDDTSSNESKSLPTKPPDDVRVVIEKMAAYVARNGAEFAEIVRAKGDPRFTFLEPGHEYHGYYATLLKGERDGAKRAAAPVSFSIKKLKEPDPILPKPALPYESSSEEETENQQTEKQTNSEENNIPKQPQAYLAVPPVMYKMDGSQESIATVKVVEYFKPKFSDSIKPQIAEAAKVIPKLVPKPVTANAIPDKPRDIERVQVGLDDTKKMANLDTIADKDSESKKDVRRNDKNRDLKLERDRKSVEKEKRDRELERDKRERDSDREKREKELDREKREWELDRDKKDRELWREERERESDREKREWDSDREKRERESSRERREWESEREKREWDPDRDKREREAERVHKKKISYSKDDLENEIISLEDNSNDMIDLTGDQSDSKDGDAEADRLKQLERRRRAAEFLKKVGVDPAAAALPTSSLASAMVDTLESLRKKKAEEEEKRRRREKRRHRDDVDKAHRKSKRRKYKSSDDNDESDCDSSKRRKRKKDKKSSKNKKKKRKDVEKERQEVDHPLPPDMDLTTTLKELRTSSPTKELVLQDVEEQTFRQESSSDEEVNRRRKKKKEEREYSEGEWSGDSEEDSCSSPSRNGD